MGSNGRRLGGFSLRRALPAVLVLAAVAATGASAAVGVHDAAARPAGSGPTAPPAPSATPTATSHATRAASATPAAVTASPTPAAAQRDEVRNAVRDYLGAAHRMRAHPSTTGNPASRVTTNAFAAALAAARDELRRSGVAQSGAARVVGDVRVGRLRVYASPPRAVVRVCLDTSQVKLVDDDGHRVQKQRPATNRTLHVYRLVRHGSAWLLDREEFPDDPDC
ncbi:MAG: hypothetical protein ACRDMV_16310 [Streptosporangiales bacterium]